MTQKLEKCALCSTGFCAFYLSGII